MSPSALPPSPPVPDHLADVIRREAWFRLKTIDDLGALQRRIDQQNARIDDLSDELGRRNTYVHELHQQLENSATHEKNARHFHDLMIEARAAVAAITAELAARNTYVHELHLLRDALTRDIRQAHADLEEFTRLLRAAEDARDQARAALAEIKTSWVWYLFKKLRRPPAPRLVAPAAATPAPLEFTYFLHTSPFRLYRESCFTLRGWAFPTDGRAVTAIRVVVDGRAFPGTHGLAEPEVAQHHQLDHSANRLPGFEVTFPVGPGRQTLRLEAQLANSDWFEILDTPIWSTAP